MSFEALKEAVLSKRCERERIATGLYQYRAYRSHLREPVAVAKGYAAAAVMREPEAVVYADDLIAGSSRGKIMDSVTEAQVKAAEKYIASFGRNTFTTNQDHFAPDYETFLKRGVMGTVSAIEYSLAVHRTDADFAAKRDFLTAAKISMLGFRDMLSNYAASARKKAQEVPENADELNAMAQTLENLTKKPPKTFREALQLVFMTYVAFIYEERYAMAFGRMDQYLYPFYKADVEKGILTQERAIELLRAALIKIGERALFGGDDVSNIAIGGCTRDGEPAINELSYAILYAVRDCNIPGPNLSARLYPGVDDRFLDECLKVIGTGLGYPALMNDDINIAALYRNGYTIEDSRDYCMVGCIENFIPGKQPPWSDGRFNTPKYLELALNNGVCMLTGVQKGPRTGEAESLTTMEQLMQALEAQMRYGAAEYMFTFTAESNRYQPLNYQQPFLSCFCADCIHRAKDICNGGAYYPSVHGAGTMGIATMADSLSAIEKLVYTEKVFTLAQLRDMLRVDYEGFEEERQMLLAVPKYGNDCPETDKYAAWFVRFQDELFSEYRTYDGGPVYIAIASNTSNIPAGKEIAATPDGRHALQPVSDAASPMHGRDVKGPTAAIKSLTVPDYTHSSCGTVVNQKYSPEMFTDPEKRKLLASIIRTYFARGGQEMQINSVSRAVLMDAREHPEDYRSLVVRVSGFSAYYTQLIPEVQQDILDRTEQS